MAATLPFREALNKGITSGTLIDTKVIVFSRKDSSGRVYGPKALYASSHVLKTVPYFDDLLFGNFAEAELKDFDSEPTDDESMEDCYGYYSDSDLEDDEDKKVTRSKPAHDISRIGPSKPPCLPGGGESYHNELANKGKIVKILDIAFVTFQAFVFYLYTERIEFAPFGFKDNRGSRMTCDKVSRPSAKSIYRLADKYDIPALKDLALRHIRSELKNCDIVEETFCAFTSRYDDIRKACVTQLLSALRNDTAEKTTWMKVCDMVDAHFKGDLQHVADTLSLLWQLTANQASSTTTTPDSAPPPKLTNNPASWNVLQIAMIKSIREGVFFDRKYWARHSRKDNGLKKVYFSSLIIGDELEPCITSSDSQSAPTRELVGDLESDCENDTVETWGSILAFTQDYIKDGDGGTRAILSPGSFSAWISLFFYKCTGQISFAPLMSQGIDSRRRYILEKTTADAPPPCSPKSVCVLATLLNIQPLHDLALKDIESKLSENNIVEEFFSRIIASEQLVAEMECRLLFSKFKNGATMTRVQEKISGTPSAHHAGAFKLGLRAALDLKECNSQAGATACDTDGVKLRCRDTDCSGNEERMSYSFAVSYNSIHCPRCQKCFMQCVGCGNMRTGIRTSCDSCGKKFV